MTDTSTRVAMLGLGEMGSALARALLAADYPLTVWNRSTGKCVPLVEKGARLASSVADAVRSADVVVVCLGDYASVAGSIHAPEIASILAGKTVVQLTTRTPREARLGEEWAAKNGVRYLEGAIQGYPMHMGTPDGTILYVGSKLVFDSTRHVLQSLCGNAVFVGEKIGSAAALDLSMAGTVVPGAVLAFLHGAAICEAEGAPVDLLFSLVKQYLLPNLVLDTMASSVEMIAKRDYAYTGSGAPLDAWIGGLEMVGRSVRDAGVDPVYSDLLIGYLRQAAQGGHGQDEMPAVFECFRAEGTRRGQG